MVGTNPSSPRIRLSGALGLPPSAVALPRRKTDARPPSNLPQEAPRVFEAGSGITRRLGPSPTRSAFPRSASCPRYACFMARDQETRDLADDDLEELLEAAAADEREGHLHHCG